MIEIYRTENAFLYEKVKILLGRKLTDFEIKKTPDGKPFIEGDPLCFSISHSGKRALIAICDRAVGVDLETVDVRPKNYAHILSRLTPRERAQTDGYEKFLLNWVSKEAYIKMLGGTLARDLKRLEYYNGDLYCDGAPVGCGHACFSDGKTGVFAVCAEGYTRKELEKAKVKQFRLRKEEII